MNIGIVGLGLIGGSLARAFSARTSHRVYGTDAVRSVALAAKMVDAIHGELTDENIGDCDFIFVCLYPQAAIQWIEEKASLIGRDAIVADSCGVKQRVCEAVRPVAEAHGFTFIGAHPMAGAAESGFKSSRENLFVRSPVILCPYTGTPIALVDRLRRLFNEIGVARTPVFTPEKHDALIAYSSQLTHVIASAYVRTDRSLECRGCTGGSFRDATRVAKLNAPMWTSLCLDDREALILEIRDFQTRLEEYAAALEAGDGERLMALFEEGKAYKLRCEK